MLDGVKQRAKEQNRTDEVIGVVTVGTVGTLYPPPKFRTCTPCRPTTQVKDAAYVKILSKRL